MFDRCHTYVPVRLLALTSPMYVVRKDGADQAEKQVSKSVRPCCVLPERGALGAFSLDH